jgi:hypothetical protein
MRKGHVGDDGMDMRKLNVIRNLLSRLNSLQLWFIEFWNMEPTNITKYILKYVQGSDSFLEFSSILITTFYSLRSSS